jgi:CheY-like chemotaxis protein
MTSIEPEPLCSQLRFLVVEDHEFQRSMIVQLLLTLGAQEVRAVADGAQALAALDDPWAAGAIMVLDLALPGTNGMELMQAMGAARPDVTIIVNSALPPDLLGWPLRTAIGYGVTVLGAVSKPLTEAKLAPLISAYRHARESPAPAHGGADRSG